VFPVARYELTTSDRQRSLHHQTRLRVHRDVGWLARSLILEPLEDNELLVEVTVRPSYRHKQRLYYLASHYHYDQMCNFLVSLRRWDCMCNFAIRLRLHHCPYPLLRIHHRV